jgi:hypothetical protein
LGNKRKATLAHFTEMETTGSVCRKLKESALGKWIFIKKSECQVKKEGRARLADDDDDDDDGCC